MNLHAEITKLAGIKLIEFITSSSIADAWSKHGSTPEGRAAALAEAKATMDSMAEAMLGDILATIEAKYDECAAVLDATNTPEAKAAREAQALISRFTLR